MTSLPIPLGRLRHRLLLEAPAETPDGAGGVARGFVAAGTVWAALEPLAAEPRFAAGQTVGLVTHRIVLRSRADLTTRHRFSRGASRYEVRSVQDSEDGAHTIVLAEEIRP